MAKRFSWDEPAGREANVNSAVKRSIIAASLCSWAMAVGPPCLCAETARSGTPVSGDSREGVTAQAEKSVRKGLDWLKSLQKENGAWSDENYPALTAFGLWAFAQSRHPDRTGICARAAGFVSGFAREDGGIYKPPTGGRGSGGLSTYNTAICMSALEVYDPRRYSAAILKAREFVAHSQLQGDSPDAGGFGYERAATGPAARADLSNTGWALMAMRQTQGIEDLRPAGTSRVDVDWASALRFIEKLQNRDASDTDHFGGFGYTLSGERGGAAVDRKTGTRQLVGYLAHWSVDENPGAGARGLFYYYSIMSKALSLAGGDSIPGDKGQPIPWKRQLVEKLARLQRADGSWVNPDNQFWEGDPVLVTAYSVLVLQRCAAEPGGDRGTRR